jgi:hypothetical protein
MHHLHHEMFLVGISTNVPASYMNPAEARDILPNLDHGANRTT